MPVPKWKLLQQQSMRTKLAAFISQLGSHTA